MDGLSRWWTRRQRARQLRYVRHGPVLYLPFAVLWLGAVWFLVLFTLAFYDYPTPEGNSFIFWIVLIGLVAGLSPLVIIMVLMIRRRRRSPPVVVPGVRPSPDWRMLGLMLLALLVLLALRPLWSPG